jgi:hypothetical protein
LKGSGKDTVAAYLVKEHNFERKAFADPLKRSIAALFDIPFFEIDKLKNRDVLVGIGEIGEPEYQQWIQYIGIKGLTFRELLQRYGTEAHRDIFGDNFWVDITLPVQGFYPGRAIVVTDVRYRNEAERVKMLGGHVISIIRGSAALGEQDQHRSEQFCVEYPHLVDHKIYNDGSLEELYESVEDLLAKTPLESVC